METMHCTLRTPERTWYDGEASLVSGASETGDLQVFPGHTAMTTTVGFSEFVIENGDHKEVFLTKQGFIHTDPEKNSIDILVFSCDKKEEVNVKSLKEYREFILEKLRDHKNLNAFQVKYLEESQSALEKQLEVLE
ncbi:hypothetical protein COX00_00435 [Candidatus Uhrbacteria bacterium CG22_combo_CG10-13_8_21_14_all_47_17]|uniref:ATP synthase epsilon chain n=1 Tax=Candidatus Uhrbacteria bacterium CG22_combo_CG10-13_8_21_14_all_47_17 TaxID=1975041 RepID=A0A2H0BTC7_9BACT|nr:MAG: hypothetical protein COX00_00435 [Candidatus Uhrbacteria bacterium CG22_combo_CG10-13_8_21_14_all_47_17]